MSDQALPRWPGRTSTRGRVLASTAQPADGAVVWLFDPVARKTGDTTSLPPQGPSEAGTTRWSKAFGGVISSDVEDGHASAPVGTSE